MTGPIPTTLLLVNAMHFGLLWSLLTYFSGHFYALISSVEIQCADPQTPGANITCTSTTLLRAHPDDFSLNLSLCLRIRHYHCYARRCAFKRYDHQWRYRFPWFVFVVTFWRSSNRFVVAADCFVIMPHFNIHLVFLFFLG